MALFDAPPHTVTTYTVVSGTDSGGGVTLTYTAAQSGLKCSINTAGSSTVLQYAQSQIRVTHTVAVLSSSITTAITRGMKLTESGGLSFEVRGIRSGRAYGNVPAFTYLDCEQLL